MVSIAYCKIRSYAMYLLWWLFAFFKKIMSAIGLNHLLTHIIAYDSSDSHFYIVSFFLCLKVGKGTWHSILRKCVQRKMSLYHVYVWRCPKENDTLSCTLCICLKVSERKCHFIMHMSEGVRRKMSLYYVYVWRCQKENDTLSCICAKVCKGKWHFIMYMCKGV